MSAAGLLIGDSRFPAGGHAHSGGVEPAVSAGIVTDLRTLEVFLRGRLRTTGLVAAGIAYAACAATQMLKYPEFRGAVFAPEIPDTRPGSQLPLSPQIMERGGNAPTGDQARHGGIASAGEPAEGGGITPVGDQAKLAEGGSNGLVMTEYWALLDAEADARTPAPAQREASRRQGRALLRAALVAWPDAAGLASLATAAGSRAARATGTADRTSETPGSSLADRASDDDAGAGTGGRAAWRGTSRAEYRAGPHHALVLGAAAAAAGCTPTEAARIAAYQAVAGPASAAVRLLALDPMRVTAILAGLAAEIDQVATQVAGHADGPLGDLPCESAPALDLLAETHVRAEVRLFES